MTLTCGQTSAGSDGRQELEERNSSTSSLHSQQWICCSAQLHSVTGLINLWPNPLLPGFWHSFLFWGTSQQYAKSTDLHQTKRSSIWFSPEKGYMLQHWKAKPQLFFVPCTWTLPHWITQSLVVAHRSSVHVTSGSSDHPGGCYWCLPCLAELPQKWVTKTYSI